MEGDIQNYLPAVMFRGTPDMFNFCLAEDVKTDPNSIVHGNDSF